MAEIENTPPVPRPAARAFDKFLGVCPLLGVIAAGMAVALHDGSSTEIRLDELLPSLRLLWRHPFALLALLQFAYLVLQTVLWLRYRPFAPGGDETLPSVTVVIPAYNEGPMVERSIESALRSDYPADRLEVIAVDDGSRDDTFFHMERLRRRHPESVRLVRFAGNRGKRAALEAGFRVARGEVIVTIDSDSEVERGTLRAMVAPFRDAKVGAVAGKVSVLNRSTFIGAMLDVQYTLAFDFQRAAQSAYRTVAVCPGALSAFRREVILPHLPEWLDQRFLGRPVAHGEDQALTNIVLHAGYDTVYQSNAVIHTLAPTHYRQLSKMFLRWERSYVVEGFSFARFMFTRYRDHNRVLPVITFFIANLRLVFLYTGLVQTPLLLLERPARVADLAIAVAVSGTVTAAYHLRKDRSLRFTYGLVYAFYSLLFLQWILPWAVVTARDERWGTR